MVSMSKFCSCVSVCSYALYLNISRVGEWISNRTITWFTILVGFLSYYFFFGWNNFFCRNELVSFYVKEECNNIRMYVIAVCNSLLYELYSIIYFCMCVIRRNGHPNQWEKRGCCSTKLGIDDNIHIRLAGAASAHMSRGILFIVGDGLHHAPGRDPSSFSYSLNLSPPPPQNARMREKLICGGVMGVRRDDDGRHKNKKKKTQKNQIISLGFSLYASFSHPKCIPDSLALFFSKFIFNIILYFLFSCLYSCSLVLEEKEIRVNKKKPYGKI